MFYVLYFIFYILIYSVRDRKYAPANSAELKSNFGS